jgi:hypothetical protein
MGSFERLTNVRRLDGDVMERRRRVGCLMLTWHVLKIVHAVVGCFWIFHACCFGGLIDLKMFS